MNKTIEDALAYADTFDGPYDHLRSVVMLATEVRRLRDEVNGLTGSLDRAEAELRKAREQEPVAWNCGGDITQNNEYAVWFRAFACKEVAPLYAAPKPAAPAVPEESEKNIVLGMSDEMLGCSWNRDAN